MSKESVPDRVSGVYIGSTPATLASGAQIAYGAKVVVDSAGEDAHLLPLIASQEPADTSSTRGSRAAKGTDS